MIAGGMMTSSPCIAGNWQLNHENRRRMSDFFVE